MNNHRIITEDLDYRFAVADNEDRPVEGCLLIVSLLYQERPQHLRKTTPHFQKRPYAQLRSGPAHAESRQHLAFVLDSDYEGPYFRAPKVGFEA